jgi:hypothetical protein
LLLEALPPRPRRAKEAGKVDEGPMETEPPPDQELTVDHYMGSMTVSATPQQQG